jgi:hypothetical protein
VVCSKEPYSDDGYALLALAEAYPSPFDSFIPDSKVADKTWVICLPCYMPACVSPKGSKLVRIRRAMVLSTMRI